LLTLEQIAQRAAREARDGCRVIIGSGLAERVRAYLSDRVRVITNGNGTKSVDIAFVSVDEVCDNDGIARKTRSNNRPLGGGSNGRTLLAKRTVVLVPRVPEGTDDIVKLLQWVAEVIKNREELRVITELAVLDVTGKGTIIREVAPGVNALDVQQATGAALYAGPDLCEIAI
jgi:acetate CoA/acetoacetate CoA-transferase beta subunit